MWMIERTNDHGILTSITNLIRQKPILYSSYADISSVFDTLLKKVFLGSRLSQVS